MFQKESIIKHYTFLIIDICSLFVAMVLSHAIRFGYVRLQLMQYEGLYIHVFIVAAASCIVGNIALKLDRHIFDRGPYLEFLAIVKSAAFILVVILAYFYMTQEGILYSRLLMGYFIFFYVVFDYPAHLAAKKIVGSYYKKSRSCRKIMLISSSDKVGQILDKFDTTNNWYFDISYITVVDKDMKGEKIQGIPVIANKEDMLEAAKNITLDGVFISVSYKNQVSFDIRKTLHDFQGMGIVVHVNIDALELDVTDKVIENLGAFKVVSYASRLRDPRQLIMKKCMDILGGLVGAALTVVVGIFVGIAIKLDSPGPIVFSQNRVGKNGRNFKMYKFRSMYIDAEERKKELLQKNEMHGAMFKIEDDPRITRVGKFIRKYSIDELPQFFNVLKGDMSLVGTRPPLAEEVEEYRVEQKKRLSVTPGMTGLWQTSGRSEIYDFDEIVKLDLEYIDKWSIGLDIKLLIKTIGVCLRGDGAK